jgi:hypothetical protein
MVEVEMDIEKVYGPVSFAFSTTEVQCLNLPGVSEQIHRNGRDNIRMNGEEEGPKDNVKPEGHGEHYRSNKPLVGWTILESDLCYRSLKTTKVCVIAPMYSSVHLSATDPGWLIG